MDCNAAQVLLSLNRPWATELDAAESAVLREHLDHCPGCAALARRAEQLDDRLGRAMRDVPEPEGLRGRLLGRLAQERVLRLRRRVLRVAAVAAALLLAIGVGWYVNYSLRPRIDAEEIVRSFEDRPYNSPEGVQEWFRETHGVTMVAPVQFNNAPLNYNLLAWYGKASLKDREVPMLVFIAQGATPAVAWVYVVPDHSFKFDESLPSRAPGSFHRVEIFRPADNPHVAFVVLYTGDSLAPFLTNQPGA